MPAIRSVPTNCRDCYKCIRHCPVKAIRASGNRTDVEDSLCIACGICVDICPQKGKLFRDDRGTVASALASGRECVLCVDGSHEMPLGPESRAKVAAAAKALGFSRVYDASGAAAAVSFKLAELAASSDSPVISAVCPVAVNLIERYHPEAIPLLAPVTSPMIAEARRTRKELGYECFLAYMGPCAAAKYESERPEHRGLIDAVITYDEFLSLMDRRELDFNKFEQSRLEAHMPCEGEEGLPQGSEDSYAGVIHIAVRGNQEISKALGCIGKLAAGAVIDLAACSTCVPVNCENPCEGALGRTLRGNVAGPAVEYELGASYSSKDQRRRTPPDEEVTRALTAIGKTRIEDRTDCGACGYDTCFDMAVAIVRGLAEPDMCMPYMKSGAEALGNMVVNESPNGVLGVRSDLTVAIANPAVCRFAGIQQQLLIGRPLAQAFEKEPFRKVFESRTTLSRITSGNCGLARARETYMHLSSKDMVVLIVSDMSREYKSREALNKARRETAEKANRVIDNQMRVAQQVAGLMGEAAAETKVLLSKLIKQLEEGNEE